jgi:hypothetical protein
MNAFGIFEQNPFVALITNFVRIFIQQLSMRSGMRVMTFCTFSRFDRGMDEWIFELLLKIVMTAQAELSLCIRF